MIGSTKLNGPRAVKTDMAQEGDGVVGCNVMLVRRRRMAVRNSEAPGSDVLAKEHQDFFRARPAWLVWVAIALLLAMGIPLGVARLTQAQATNQTTVAASADQATLAPCKAAGMFAYQMAIKRDQGVSKEEMLSRYQPNEIMDKQVWSRMLDMVYSHPEKSPEAIERAFTSHCWQLTRPHGGPHRRASNVSLSLN